MANPYDDSHTDCKPANCYSLVDGQWITVVATESRPLICTKCGKSLLTAVGTVEALRGEAHWGYGSRKDMTKWRFCLCEDCADALREWLGKMEICDALTDGTQVGEWHDE